MDDIKKPLEKNIVENCNSLKKKPHKPYNPLTLKIRKIECSRDALNLVGRVLRLFSAGKISDADAKTITYIANSYVNMDDTIRRNIDLEKRLSEIEQLYGITDMSIRT